MVAPVDVAASFCAVLVDTWVDAGVTDAVVCPGSRSTPMALALAQRSDLRVHTHIDERAAGFMALGIAMATGRPAPVLTTSGTAAVELHPAVVEAHHGRVPFVACTADRPVELVGVGAPQTIDQRALFGSAVRLELDPGVPDIAAAGSWRQLADRVLRAATGSPAGPVHLNLRFREPLLGDAGALRLRAAPQTAIRAGTTPAPATEDLEALAGAITGRRGLIVAGGGVQDAEGVAELSQLLRWPVLADQRSGCRIPATSTIAHADALLRHEGFAAAHRPEVVLRLGALAASKVVLSWLDGLDAWQLGIDGDGWLHDPGGSLSAVVAAEPGRFCGELADRLSPGPEGTPGWLESWARADAEAAAAIGACLAGHGEVTEPAVARDALACVPDGGSMVVSSSMPIRDLEWYAPPREGVRVLANRGANGIDGVLSTAVGVAVGSGAPVLALVGDLAFLHDTNALIGLTGREVALTIVVIDNDGGGIFELLDQARHVERSTFEQLFATPHGLDPGVIATAYGLGVHRVGTQREVRASLASVVGNAGAAVVRVRTDRRANARLHRELHDSVAEAIDSLDDPPLGGG